MDKRLIIIIILLLIIAILSAIVFNKFKAEEDINPNYTPIPSPSTITSGEEQTNNIAPIPSPIQPAKPAEDKSVEVTEEMAKNIKENSFLDILIQIKNFNNLNINYEPLLEAAMRIGAAKGLLQTQTEGVYLEYLPRSVVNDIIYELSGVRVTDPIIIDDFYYVYDQEGDYYYVVPIGANWLQLNGVDSISYTKDDLYIVKCTASGGNEDYGEYTLYPSMELKLKYKPSNKYINYQLISISTGKED